MNAIERLNRLKMARDFAVQAENAMMNLRAPLTQDEGYAIANLGKAINKMGEAIQDAEMLTATEKGIRTL